MSIQVVQKQYAGVHPHPSVELSIHQTDRLIILGIPWGEKQSFTIASENIAQYFSSSTTDSEATSPFAKLPNLSTNANCLRIGTMLANESVYQKFNQQELKAGCELAALNFNNNEMNWIHFGQPHILIMRDGGIHQIQNGLDLGFQFNNPVSLPEKMLGAEVNMELETHSVVLQKRDKVILMVRSIVPRACFAKRFDSQEAAVLCQQIFDESVNEKSDTPFWIGVIDL